MTERKPAGVSPESWIERQIREAQQRGDFEGLAGTGKPIEGLDRPHDEMWWIKEKLRGATTISGPPTTLMPLQIEREVARWRAARDARP